MSPAIEELVRSLARAAVADHLAGLPERLGSTPEDLKEPIDEEAKARAAQEPRQ